MHYFAQAELSAWLAEAKINVAEILRQEYPEPDGSITIDMIFLCEHRDPQA